MSLNPETGVKFTFIVNIPVPKSILLGIRPGSYNIDLDVAELSAEEREILSLNAYDLRISADLVHRMKGVSAEHLRQAIRDVLEERRKLEEEKQKELEKFRSDILSLSDEQLRMRSESSYFVGQIKEKIPELYPTVSKYYDEHCRRIEREKKEQEELRRKKDQEILAAIDAGKNKLHAWALQNGSELLKTRIANGFSWGNLALKEYMLKLEAHYAQVFNLEPLGVDSYSAVDPSDTPEPEEFKGDDLEILYDKPINTPSKDQISVWNAAKEAVKTDPIVAGVQLVNVKVRDVHDERTEFVKCLNVSIDLGEFLPDNRTYDMYFKLPTPERE